MAVTASDGALGGGAQPLDRSGIEVLEGENVEGIGTRSAGDLRPITRQVAVAMITDDIVAAIIDQHLRRELLSAD